MDQKQLAFYQGFQRIAKPFFDITVDTSIMNPQNVPDEGPFILVANHRSDMDPFILIANIRREINWIGASYLWNIPLAGWFLGSLGAAPISKFKSDITRGFDYAEEIAAQGQGIGIFPEGWDYIARNQFDWSVGRFQTGFARLALRTGAPVVPVALMGLSERRAVQAFPPFLRKVFDYPIEMQYIKDRCVYHKLHINVGRPIPVPDGADPGDREMVKQLTIKANEAVKTLYNAMPDVIGFEGVTPEPAAPGMGQPLAEDMCFDDLLEGVKSVRRAAKAQEYQPDAEVLERLREHRKTLKKLAASDDPNVEAMAEEYLDWVRRILDAARRKIGIDDRLEQYVKRFIPVDEGR